MVSPEDGRPDQAIKSVGLTKQGGSLKPDRWYAASQGRHKSIDRLLVSTSWRIHKQKRPMLPTTSLCHRGIWS